MRCKTAFGLFGLWLMTVAATKPEPVVIEPGADLYPADALEQEIEGDVPITLSISPNGDLRCSISAGAVAPALLKRPSCMLIAARDVFPPRVENGQPVATSIDLIVRWRKATDNRQFGGAVPIARSRWMTYADYPPAAYRNVVSGRAKVSFDITPMGRAVNCKVAKTNASLMLGDGVCALIQERAAFLPALGPDNQPKATKGWFNTNWRWCPGSYAAGCPGPDDGP